MGYIKKATPNNLKPGSLDELARFSELQAKLSGMFRRVVRNNRQPHTAIIVPSLTLPPGELMKVEGVSFYEERLLCMLMLLRNPRMRLILVTSLPIHPTIIDYYLHLLTGVPRSHARRRLILLTPFDASPQPLTQKILSRRNLLVRIRREIMDPEAAHLVCFNSTPMERTLAVQLDIPLYSCDPNLLAHGTKSGSREIFREAGVEFPPGFERLHTKKEVAESLLSLKISDPALRRAVVKLNEGFSGEGNAIFNFTPELAQALENTTSKGEKIEVICKALYDLKFESKLEDWEHFSCSFKEMGGVVEAFVEGEIKLSPSAQCRVNPLGEAQTISTHDQILGGPSRQVFIGCTFPAARDYRLEVQALGHRVAEVLASKGVIGRFAVDFISVQDPDTKEWTSHAIEINLRKGGTTHPFQMLQFLTNGNYDMATGLFEAPSGRAKFYIASDNFSQEHYKGLHPDDLIDISVYHNLHFDSAKETGVVFHLIGSLSEYGKTGVTCIGDTLEQAESLYQKTTEVLDIETRKSGYTVRLETL